MNYLKASILPGNLSRPGNGTGIILSIKANMAKKKENRGGARPGTGPKPVDGKKKVTAHFTIHPDVLVPFREIYGRGTSARIEELMKLDLNTPPAISE